MMKYVLILIFGLLGGALEAAPADPTLVRSSDQGKAGDQMLIHKASLLPSGIYSLRRQKSPDAMARALPQKKPRKRLNPDSMATEMNVGR